MAFVLGDLRVFYITEVGSSSITSRPVACVVSQSLSENTEFVGTTTRENAGWRTSKPVLQSFSIQLSAISDYPDASSRLVYGEVKDLMREKTKINWRIEDTTNNTLDYGYGYISSVGEQSPANDFMTFDFTVEGYGRPYSVLPPTPVLSSAGSDASSVDISWAVTDPDNMIDGYAVYTGSWDPASTTIVGADTTTDTIFKPPCLAGPTTAYVRSLRAGVWSDESNGIGIPCQ